jgi:DNA-directed RNA polymerase subunit RPC12/RpoP
VIPAPRREQVTVEEGKIWVPGAGRLPLIGPDPKKLEDAQRQQQKRNIHIRRQLFSVYQCLQCKRKLKGRNVRVKWEMRDGIRTELLVCNDSHCQGPVIVFRDAFDLLNPPQEQKATLRDTVIPWSDMQRCTVDAFRSFLDVEYARSGMGTEVEIGRQVGCPHCRESVVLQKNWRWEVTR